jgi:hypothetical protein
MKYHPRRLTDVYSFLLEGDTESSQLSTILKMPVERLGSHLRSMKISDPEQYGRLVFKASLDHAGRQRIIDALKT